MEVTDLINRIVQNYKLSPQLRPTIYAQFAGKPITSWPIHVFSGSGREKAQTLFNLGREVARRPENAGKELLESVLVTEIWGAAAGPVRPISLPESKREEAVMLLKVVNQLPFKTHADYYSILRKSGKVAELVFKDASDEVEGLLAQSFTAGCRSLAVSDEQLKRLPFDPRPFLR
ncbi:MAG: hypothetical protein ACRDHZ_00095 [Ktedonobacteraceae bacterium]